MSDFERIRDLRAGLPAPRPEPREAARAALVGRFDAAAEASSKPPRRFLRARNLALAGVMASVATALLIVLGTGGSSGVRPVTADAADLTELAELAPHLEIAGGWQITHTEVAPGGGATAFHYVARPAEAVEGPTDAEIQWHTASVEEVGQQLQAEGFQPAGTQPTRSLDALEMRAENWDAAFTAGTAQVYASREPGESVFQAVGVWKEGDWTLQLSASVEDLEMLERLLERVELLGSQEWQIAIRPGGGMWLRDSMDGTVQRVENVKIERPDGSVVYETRMFSKTPKQMEELDFTAPFPVIKREGDRVEVEVERAPAEVPESP